MLAAVGLAAACVAAFFALALLLARRRPAKVKADDDGPTATPDRCANADCVRCKNYNKFTPAVISAALESAKRRLDVTALPRLDAALDRSQAQQRLAPLQEPTVFFVPGLTARPLWIDNRAFAATASGSGDVLSAAIEPLLADIALVREEIEDFVFDCAASGDMSGWRANDCAAGSWDVFPLVSQGALFAENARRLPRTWSAVTSIDGYACGRSCFGNVFVSVLGPASRIAPHCGPTNVRLRAHVPIRVPHDAACSLTAGADDLVRAETNHWLCFDDSFLHSARNDSPAEDRIVLIVDLWHVDLTADEREALREMFPAV
jgi:hypothetical protein